MATAPTTAAAHRAARLGANAARDGRCMSSSFGADHMVTADLHCEPGPRRRRCNRREQGPPGAPRTDRGEFRLNETRRPLWQHVLPVALRPARFGYRAPLALRAHVELV